MRLLLAACLLATLSGCCCFGDFDHERLDYKGEPIDFDKDGDNAYLSIACTHTSVRDFAYWNDKYGEPYTLKVHLDAARDYDRPLRVYSAKLIRANGDTVVVHSRKRGSKSARLEKKQPSSSRWRATVGMPLGDELKFREGAEVTVEAEVKLPEEKRKRVLRRTFVGTASRDKGKIGDAYMGI